MNKKLMLTAILVVGALIAPAAKADHVEGDWCGHYCSLIDRLTDLFGGDAIEKSDRPVYTDQASDNSGRDIARTDAEALGDGRDSAPRQVDYRRDSLIPEKGAHDGAN